MDLSSGASSATGLHDVVNASKGEVTLLSRQYPFCAEGPLGDDSSMRSGMEWVPFFQDLSQFVLKVRKTEAPKYRVVWGEFEKVFTSDQMQAGINLADAFPVNPFSGAFQKVDSAVAAKQSYETRQIKQIFHGPEGRQEPELAAALTEKVRAPLAEEIRKSFQPVKHTIRVVAE